MRYFKLGLVAAALTLAFSALPAQAESALDTVKERGVLRAGVRFDTPPYGFIDDAGKNVGIDVEIVEEVAKRLGVKLELQQVTGQSRIPTLTSGKVDLLAAALTHTRERDKVVDFSITYVHDGIGALVRKDSGIAKLTDLNGKSVSVIAGSSLPPFLAKIAPDAKLLEYQESPQAFIAFQQGVTDAFASPALALDKFRKTDASFVILPEFFAPEPIALAVRQDDSKWRDTLNNLLQDIVTDGTWDRIVKSYVSLDLKTPEIFP